MRRVLIAAKSLNNIIGANNTIPWRLKSDLAYFKEVTMNCPMIMGRKTFESLPGILPGRKHIIITNNLSCLSKYQDDPRVQAVSSIEEGLRYAKTLDTSQVFIIGGGEIYKDALRKKLVDHMILTEVDLIVDGDVKFPHRLIIDHEWREDFEFNKVEKNNIKYTVKYLTRKAA